MSSRIPPSSLSDSRYTPRDRSQQGFDRRSSAPYGGGPLAPRVSEPGYRPTDSQGYSGPGRDLPREPPRGPKALIDGPRGGGSYSRGRGFGGRGDRDYRDLRDAHGSGRGRERDWGGRDTFENRERRPSPTGRNRSRSPALRDLRDPREFPSRDTEQSRIRRGSRDGPLSASSSISDIQPSTYRGRGGYRGRARGDWDHNRRGRGGFHEEREAFRPRSRSHDRTWDRNRERDKEITRRDDDTRKDSDARGRESDRYGKDQLYRPDSRNSTSTQISPLTPHPTPAVSSYQVNAERFAQNSRAFSAESSRRVSEAPGASDPLRDIERADPALSRPGRDRPGPGTVSPPPQAPQVPAFGSIAYRTPSNDQISAASRNHNKIGGPLWSRPQNATRDMPSGSKAEVLSKAPTGPKAGQKVEMSPIADSAGTNRQPYSDERANYEFTNPTAMTPAPTVTGAEQYPPVPQTSGQHREAPDVHTNTRAGPSPESQTAGDQGSTQLMHAVGNKMADDRQVNMNSSTSAAAPFKPTLPDTPTQASHPAKIPTGPKAERSAPPSRQIVAPPARASPLKSTIVPPRQPRNSNWKWVRPGLAQHTPRGPSIMNTIPTKRDFVSEDRLRATPTDSGSRISEVQEGPRAKLHIKAGQIDRKIGRTPETDQAWSDSDVREERTRYSGEDRTDVDDGFQQPNANNQPPEIRKSPDSDDVGMEEGAMELDEADILEAEQKFEQQIQALELKRPATPRHHPILLQLLDECDALASAAEDIAKQANTKPEETSSLGPMPIGLPSPKLEEPEKLRFEEEPLFPMLSVKTRRPTPPVENLPFLISGLPTPFSELEDLQEQIDQHELIKARIVEDLLDQRQRIKTENNYIIDKYAADYRRWKIGVEITEVHDRSNITTMPEPNSPTLATVSSTTSASNVGGRRAAKNATELDIINVLKESAMIAEKDEERRNQERILQAKDIFNPEKEANIPDMLDRFERKACLFNDTNHLIDSELVLGTLGFIPKQDDFTLQEQEAFLDIYLPNPKKWGIIAEVLPGRDYQDCVLHYYHTKAEAQYKEKEKAFARIAKKGRKGGRSLLGRPKLNALMPYDGTVEYDTPQIPVTDTGRPRRAAAPTFGDTTDPEPSTPAATPARRNISGNKGDPNGDSSERPTNKRTRTAPAKEKGAKRGRVPILAAAPGPSPQKADKEIARGQSKEPKLESEQRIEEIEGAQLLAGLHSSQTVDLPVGQPALNETYLGVQPASLGMPIPSQKPPPPPQQQQTILEQPQQPQQLSRGAATTTSSYWSVPEQTDFQNLIHHFGTDFQAIANTMKSKTPTMVKNYYHRVVERDETKAVEKAAQVADQKIRNGEDMGPPPMPTIIPKRRYDTTPQIAPQRPLAPSVDSIEIEGESPRLQPIKSTQYSPPHYSQPPAKLPVLAQAEPISVPTSSQASPKGVVTPTARTLGQAQRTSQQLHGPRVGFFAEERSRPILQAQPAAQQQQQHQVRLQAQQDLQHQQHQILLNQQDFEDVLRLQSQARLKEARQSQQATSRHQLTVRTQQIQEQPASSQHQPSSSSSQIRIAPLQPVEADIRPRISGQSLQQMPQKQSQQYEPQPQQRRVESPTLVRHIDTYGQLQNRTVTLQSPASARLPFTVSPQGDSNRPSSVPASVVLQQAARPPPAPPKKSSIMDILNAEPAEPHPRKRLNDQRPVAPTPPPQSPATITQMYPQPNHALQQIHRRATPTESAHHLQQHHRPPPPSQPPQQYPQHQQQPQPQPREITGSWPAAPSRSLFEQQRSSFQSQPTNSPQLQPSFTQLSSRATFQPHQRNHTPPPPFSHSRASSYTSAPSQHQQPQPQPPPPQQSTQPTPPIQPNPYSQGHPPYQSLHSQQVQHHHLQPSPRESQPQPHQQIPLQQRPPQPQPQPQPQAQDHSQSFHHRQQFLRQNEAMRQQELLQQQQQRQADHRIQQDRIQQERSMQLDRSVQMQALRREREEATRRREDAQREEMGRRGGGGTYTPPQQGQYGGIGGGHVGERGRYDGR